MLFKNYSSSNTIKRNGIIITRNYIGILCTNINYNNKNNNKNNDNKTKYNIINNNIVIKRKIITDTIPSIFEIIQSSLFSIKTMGQLPWWTTFALSTIIVRTSMFPLVRSQLIYTKKITNAIPEISFLYQLLNKRLQGISIQQTEERLKIINVFIKGVSASLKLHDFSILKMLSYPAANISIFLTFIISIREMIKNDINFKYGFDDGGLLWFMDLTMKDNTFILPFLAITLSYTALDIAFSNGKGKFFIYTKDFCQCITLLSIPFVIQLPSGIFFYWIPSSMFAITQSLLLRNPNFQKLINIPSTKPKHLDATNSKKEEE